MDEKTQRRKDDMRDTIIQRMRAMRATSLADDELERCFKDCAGHKVLMMYAKEFRDTGYMTLEQVLAN